MLVSHMWTDILNYRSFQPIKDEPENTLVSPISFISCYYFTTFMTCSCTPTNCSRQRLCLYSYINLL